MKTNVSELIIYSVNRLNDTRFMSKDFEVFVHAEDSTSDYWGIWSWVHDRFYIICRHGNLYKAYECKDRTHVRYMMLKMAF